jgi:hypothetical protein
VANCHPLYLLTYSIIMELTRTHREALIIELKETIQALRKSNDLTELYLSKGKDEFLPYREVESFLLEQKIKTIETALMDNQIDY